MRGRKRNTQNLLALMWNIINACACVRIAQNHKSDLKWCRQMFSIQPDYELFCKECANISASRCKKLIKTKTKRLAAVISIKSGLTMYFPNGESTLGTLGILCQWEHWESYVNGDIRFCPHWQNLFRKDRIFSKKSFLFFILKKLWKQCTTFLPIHISALLCWSVQNNPARRSIFVP